MVAPILAAPEGDTVFLGKYGAEIVPEQMRSITLPEQGVVTDLVDASGRITKDTVVARVNADQIALKEQETEISILRERVSKKDEIRKLEKQKAELQFYSSLPQEQRKYQTKPGDAEPTAEALADLDERIALARRELTCGEERKRQDFQKTIDTFVVRMPYNGRLQYHFSLPEEQGAPVKLDVGQPFISVCNDAAFYITMPIPQTEITQLPAEKLSVEIALPENKTLRGMFARRRVEQSSGGTKLVYFFRIPKEDDELAYSMLGSSPTARLFFSGGSGVSLVGKKELALDPRAKDATEWAELAAMVYPDCTVVVVAEDAVVLRKK